MNISSVKSGKMRLNYVNKLNQQIQSIESQATTFNIRESTRQGPRRVQLKTLSQPKYQNLLLRPQLNPEKKEIQINTKISKFFKNCSAYSQMSFIADADMISDCSNSILIESKVFGRKSLLQDKVQQKKKEVVKNWKKVDSFRQTNSMADSMNNLGVRRKIKTILEKVEKRRPLTAVQLLSTIN